MAHLEFPFGKGKMPLDIADSRLLGVLTSGMHDYIPTASEEELVRAAMEAPIGTPKREELARGKDKVVIIASDHTRPCRRKSFCRRCFPPFAAGTPMPISRF